MGDDNQSWIFDDYIEINIFQIIAGRKGKITQGRNIKKLEKKKEQSLEDVSLIIQCTNSNSSPVTSVA